MTIELDANPKVVVTSRSFAKSAVLRQELLKVFPNSIFTDHRQKLPRGEITDFIGDADAAIVGVETIDDSVLKHTTKLRVISKYGVGLDNIDLESLKSRDIFLGWTGGTNKRSVSELTLCFMLGLCRNVFGSSFKLKKLEWEKDGGHQLSGKTVGIIGCGHTGSDVVRLLAPFGCNLLVNDIVDKSKFCQEQRASQVSLNVLLEQSNIISLHVPLTKQTHQMVNANFLQQMRSTGFLINTSRGKVVDQDALKKALTEDNIGGAALDVFEEEPLTDKDFISLPNLMITPHIGGNSLEGVEAMGRAAIKHLVLFFDN
jgi:phosphoglycerate dehydrogenase-like enzyme